MIRIVLDTNIIVSAETHPQLVDSALSPVGQTIALCRLSACRDTAKHDRPHKAMACPTRRAAAGETPARVFHPIPPRRRRGMSSALSLRSLRLCVEQDSPDTGPRYCAGA